MALSVATNIGALSASKAASSVNKVMEVSMARLASGKRINGAADDSAGLAIASRLTSEARGLDMAARNAADGQALLDTAESAHSEIANILQRMRELAVQGANDTNGTADRTNIRTELTELKEEIDAIASQTKWAGNTLISAATTFKFQVGDEGSEQLTVTTSLVSASALATGGALTAISALTTSAKFTSYVDTVNSAIATVATYRAELGANSNRLDHIMSHLATSSESVKASLGRIEDADYAAETTSLAKSQILQQAATSMLAQANASKQSVLSLLQG